MERILNIIEKFSDVILAAILQTDYEHIISLVRANEKMHRSQNSGQYEFVVSDENYIGNLINPSAFQSKERAEVQISLNITEIRVTSQKLSKRQKCRVIKYCNLIDDFESALTVNDWKKYESEIVELLASLQSAHRFTRRRRVILAIIIVFVIIVLFHIASSQVIIDYAIEFLQNL